jgi:coatomer protein complex subunit gamma
MRGNAEMIKRWLNEVSECLNSSHPMVQYHGLNLMYELKKQDRLALQKLVCGFATGQQGGDVGSRPPAVETLLISHSTGMIISETDPQIIKLLLSYLVACLRNKSDIVTFEAARALCYLAQIETEQSGSRRLNATATTVMGVDFSHALTILQIGLGSPKSVKRLAALRTLNQLCRSRPVIVSRCNVDIDPLLSDENRNIATLALTVLLKTAQESNVDKLVKQIGSFMDDLSDIYRLDVVSAIRSLSESYPSKYRTMMAFLASALRDENSQEVKSAVTTAIIAIVHSIPESLDLGLMHLCEFIEDCEFPNLCASILTFLTEHVPRTSEPTKYVRFIYNRVILENAAVRLIAVESLYRIAVLCKQLKKDIALLLNTAKYDSDDEVRDRVVHYLESLNHSDVRSVSTFSGISDDEQGGATISIDALFESLQDYMNDPVKVSHTFDIKSVPDEIAYREELRTREAAAAAASAAREAATKAPAVTGGVSMSSGISEAALEGARPEFLVGVGAIINVELLGHVQHICKPVMLTEPEAEYTVEVVKHVYLHHTVMEFFIRNTVENVVLRNVLVKLGNVDPASWGEIGSVPIQSLSFNEGKSAVTVLARNGPTPIGTFPATLHFIQHEDGDQVGFPDDFAIDSVKISIADYIGARPLPLGQFPRAWESLAFEKIQKYSLNYRTLEAAIGGLQSSLNMAACEGTERIEVGTQRPTLLLAGNYIGGVPLLVQIILFMHPQRGCMIQLTARGGTEQASEAPLGALK